MTRPQIPFVVGVTGNMDPVGYSDDRATCDAHPDVQRLKAQLHDLLHWITGLGGHPRGGSLDPLTGSLRATAEGDAPWWRSLELAQSNTPVLILSSLAPGVDTLMVEVAADYHHKHPEARVEVMCPLPFPLSAYRRASTFRTPGAQERFDRTLALIAQTWPGRPMAERCFPVSLADDATQNAAQLAADDLAAVDAATGKPRRHLRYRAAGEYVATYSQLLVAVYDQDADAWPETRADRFKLLADRFRAGTAATVESKRSGLTPDLLAMPNNVAWADNGPTLVVPVRRAKSLGAAPPVAESASRPLRFVHPYDTLPPEVPTENAATAADRPKDRPDDDHDWQRAGFGWFRKTISRQQQFNRLPAAVDREDGELENLVGARVLKHDEAASFAQKLDPAAKVRGRAALEARSLSRDRDGLLWRLAVLIFVAAVSFGAFEHWHNPRAHHESPAGLTPWWAHDPQSWIQAFLLLVTLTCLWRSARQYFGYLQAGAETHRYDYRALGEALRVQVYWMLAGTGRSVSAEFMQRQRDELDWIRYAVASISLPLDTNRAQFESLKPRAQHALLHAVRHGLVVKQIEYHQANAKKKNKKGHDCHTRGWTLANAGLLSIVSLLAVEVSPAISVWLHDYHVALAGAFVAIGLLMFVVGRGHDSHEPSDMVPAVPQQFWRWVWRDPAIWGGALAVHGAVLVLAFSVGYLGTVWPDEHNAWIILLGTVLVGAGLSVAWAERNFFSEDARVSRSMVTLLTSASSRLDLLLGSLVEASVDQGRQDEANRLRREIQDIYYQVGCEALDETAEWLIQHRSRPIEPFMAG